jgi:hypothetical protein
MWVQGPKDRYRLVDMGKYNKVKYLWPVGSIQVRTELFR